jgi:hypothetical protein
MLQEIRGFPCSAQGLSSRVKPLVPFTARPTLCSGLAHGLVQNLIYQRLVFLKALSVEGASFSVGDDRRPWLVRFPKDGGLLQPERPWGQRFNYCIREVDKIFYKFMMIHFQAGVGFQKSFQEESAPDKFPRKDHSYLRRNNGPMFGWHFLFFCRYL